MGEALLGGVLGAGAISSEQVVIVEPVAARREELVGRYSGLQAVNAVSDLVTIDELRNGQAVWDALLAVKPGYVVSVCEAVGALAHRPRRVLSIAAGVTISKIETALGPAIVVLRAMPNTPALVGAAATAVAAASTAGPDDVAWAEALLGSVGQVCVVNEAALDAVTGLSGSGPAYVFLVIESLIEGGVAAGLPREVATTLAVQTVLGAAQLAAQTATPPAILRADVTSPGGTTAAGLRALEQRGVRSAFIEAVLAATAKSVDLGAS